MKKNKIYRKENINMQTMYESGEYLAKNPTWDEEDSFKKVEWIIRILERRKIYPNSIFEIGCGSGAILQNISKKYQEAECLGSDISPQAIKIAKDKESKKLKFICGDLPKNKIDLLLCIDVFEHVEDYFGFLRNLQAKSEYKIFHIPLDMNIQKIFRKNRLLKDRKDVGHIHYFSKETAIATLVDCGFSIIDFEYTCASEVPSGRKSPKVINLLRKFLFKLCPDLCVRFMGGYSLLVLTK